ncbi:MAG: 2-oxo acid dehydrogenase subunit E2, partial [Crocinitomicaceae bacterium]|nr:2-oxo acid dehydrogenase subunit E2 [Crocinitomicaceae bacterium]
MAEIEIRLPKMGESVTEATITNWLKEVGDTVEMDEPLVEVATDKVDNELPSEAKGVLVKRLYEKNDVVQVGEVIAIISTGGDSKPVAPTTSSQPVKTETAAKPVVAEKAAVTAQAAEVDKTGPSGKFYSPLVRSIAKEEGISMAQL